MPVHMTYTISALILNVTYAFLSYPQQYLTIKRILRFLEIMTESTRFLKKTKKKYYTSQITIIVRYCYISHLYNFQP